MGPYFLEPPCPAPVGCTLSHSLPHLPLSSARRFLWLDERCRPTVAIVAEYMYSVTLGHWHRRAGIGARHETAAGGRYRLCSCNCCGRFVYFRCSRAIRSNERKARTDGWISCNNTFARSLSCSLSDVFRHPTYLFTYLARRMAFHLEHVIQLCTQHCAILVHDTEYSGIRR